MAEKPTIISGASVNETLVKPVGRSMRLDKELNQMLKQLLLQLQDYETTLGPLVDQAKIIKGQIRASLSPGQKISNVELKRLIGEKLVALGANSSVDTSAGNFRDLGRYISSLLATNPGAMGDIIEQSLSAAGQGDLKEAGKIGARYQKGLVELMPFMVGHHEQGLRGYREVLEYLEKVPGNLRQRVLHILERKYGANFGEEGLRYLFPFAHKASDIGPVGSTKHSPRGGVRKDIKALFDEAFPELKGNFHNLDQINPNLRKLIEPLIAHSTAARGTHGFKPILEKIKGLTDPDQIAEVLVHYVDANRATYTNAQALNDAIWKHGVQEITLPDGTTKTVINKAAWSKGGVVETAIQKIPITSVAQEPPTGWGKNPSSRLYTRLNRAITPATRSETAALGGQTTNLFSVDAGGAGALYMEDFFQGVKLNEGFETAARQILNNIDDLGLDARARVWLLNQGPERLATALATDFGIGTAIGTAFDEEQRTRFQEILGGNRSQIEPFINKAIVDEAQGQLMWHGGRLAWKHLVPQGVKSAIGTGFGYAKTAATFGWKASPYTIPLVIRGSTASHERVIGGYHPFWRNHGFDNEADYINSLREERDHGTKDGQPISRWKLGNPIEIQEEISRYDKQFLEEGKIFQQTNEEDEDTFTPPIGSSLFSTNLFSDKLGLEPELFQPLEPVLN